MAKKKGVDLTIIVDVIHVIEYLWKAGRAFHPETSLELENWVQHRLLEILKGKAGYVAGGMRRSATRRCLAAAARKPVDACARYLLNPPQADPTSDMIATSLKGCPLRRGSLKALAATWSMTVWQ